MKGENLANPLLCCILGLACALLVAGCTTSARSISHSYSYPPQQDPTTARLTPSDPDFEYRGELSEFDVLGIARSAVTSEADIRSALENAKPIKLHPGSSILLIQSGAFVPDGPMVTELGKRFNVLPFSGIPNSRRIRGFAAQGESADPEGYSQSLRLAAARGGADAIVCYWGTLEAQSDKLATKTVSWVPIVHWIVPDETQHMRIRLKVALIDVRTGNWSVFSPKPFDDARVSTSPHRGAVDQKQVESLKNLAYAASAEELANAFK